MTHNRSAFGQRTPPTKKGGRTVSFQIWNHSALRNKPQYATPPCGFGVCLLYVQSGDRVNECVFCVCIIMDIVSFLQAMSIGNSL